MTVGGNQPATVPAKEDNGVMDGPVCSYILVKLNTIIVSKLHCNISCHGPVYVKIRISFF